MDAGRGVDELVAGFVAGLGQEGRESITETAGVRFLADWFLVLLLGAIPIVAVIGRVVFRRAGFNLAEHAVFATYVYAQQALLVGALSALGAVLRLQTWSGLAALVVAAGYYVYAALGFFRIGLPGDVFRALFAVVLAMAAYAVLLVFAIGVIIGMAEHV